MGTYEDSRFRKARKPYSCKGCGGMIRVGERYLSYMHGLVYRHHVCTRCAVKQNADGQPRYHCAVVISELNHPTPNSLQQ